MSLWFFYVELKTFINENDTKVPSVRGRVVIVARVVWTSFETCSTGSVIRLHLIDKQAPETLELMHEVRSVHVLLPMYSADFIMICLDAARPLQYKQTGY
jgi:hypothetical protein